MTSHLLLSLLVCYINAVEVNRTVDFSWSNPIRDDPFLSTPILPMSIPYYVLEVYIISSVHIEYYVDIPQVELYIKYFDPAKSQFQEVPLHTFNYAPRIAPLQNKTTPYIEFPYKVFIPDPSYFTGQTINMRFKASTNAPNGYIQGQLGYISLSKILNNTNFPLNCSNNMKVECRSFGYFAIDNSTREVDVTVDGFTSVPPTIDIWGRNALIATNIARYHMNGRNWSTEQTIKAANTTYFLFSTLLPESSLTSSDYGIIQWSWKLSISGFNNSTTHPFAHLKERILSFVELLGAAGIILTFVAVAQRCQKNRRKNKKLLKEQYEPIN